MRVLGVLAVVMDLPPDFVQPRGVGGHRDGDVMLRPTGASPKPVLLVLIGSDLSMMEALNSYGHPSHQRGREMVLGPLNPVEVGQMLGLDPAKPLTRHWSPAGCR